MNKRRKFVEFLCRERLERFSRSTDLRELGSRAFCFASDFAARGWLGISHGDRENELLISPLDERFPLQAKHRIVQVPFFSIKLLSREILRSQLDETKGDEERSRAS